MDNIISAFIERIYHQFNCDKHELINIYNQLITEEQNLNTCQHVFIRGPLKDKKCQVVNCKRHVQKNILHCIHEEED